MEEREEEKKEVEPDLYGAQAQKNFNIHTV